MLIGEYTSNVTSGNRISIPKKFRKELTGDVFILTRGYEGCLVLVTKEQFKNLTQEVANQPFIAGDVRDTTRFLLGGAHEVSPDSQGRFVVPENLREHGQIQGEVVFLGLGNRVEVWDRRRWEEHREKLDRESAIIADRLSNISKAQ